MHEIRIPRLGWSMEEGTFIGWLKQPGDAVAVGDPLFELEGEKAQQEIESTDAGTLQIAAGAPQPGDVVPVGTLLGYLLAVGESMDEIASPATPTSQVPATEVIRQPEITCVITQTTAGPVASMRARRVAKELGVDWKALAGSGRDGRVREADVRAAHSESPATTPASSGVSSRRKAIAERLRLARDRTIPVTLSTIADANNLVGLRDQFKQANAEVAPSYNDILARLAATVLVRHPQMSVRWNPAEQSLVPIAANQIHVGIAVDTADGLIVPVVREVLSKSLPSIARESKALIERALAGKLSAAEMQDGAITITNLGAWGVDAFTPVINYPEIAILGIGAIRRQPVVLADDRIVPQDRITLNLTFDHAAVDGAPAAAFLRDIVAAVENPAARLLST